MYLFLNTRIRSLAFGHFRFLLQKVLECLDCNYSPTNVTMQFIENESISLICSFIIITIIIIIIIIIKYYYCYYYYYYHYYYYCCCYYYYYLYLLPRHDLAYAESDEDDKLLETQRKLDRLFLF